MRALASAVLILLVVAGAARADDRRRLIAVLDIKVEGVPAEIATQFQNSLESQLDSKRYWLVTRAKMKERMAASTRWTDGCLLGKCLLDVHTQTGADLVLLASLSGSGTSYGYVVTLVRTDVGEAVAQQSDRCDVCTMNEVMTNATLATIQLINAVPDTLPDRNAERAAAVELATAPLKQEVARDRRRVKHLGVGLTIAGLVVGGVGAGLLATQGTKPAAMGVAGAGLGALVGGLTILTF